MVKIQGKQRNGAEWHLETWFTKRGERFMGPSRNFYDATFYYALGFWWWAICYWHQ